MLANFRRINVKDTDVRLVQDSVDRVFTTLLPKEILDGRHIKDIVIIENPVSSGTYNITIEHKLGRAMQGWIVTSNNTDSRVWDNQSTNAIPLKTLDLEANTPTTISVWVF